MLTFLGDVALLSDNLTSSYTPAYPFVVNLEYVVGDNTLTPVPNKINLLSSFDNLTRVFKKSPVAVNVANNHALDFGICGLKSTLDHIHNQGIDTFGEAPFSVDRIHLISFTLSDGEYNSKPLLSFQEEKFLKEVDLAKKSGACRIVVHLHWGIENHPLNSKKQTELGHWLIDNGADIVIGCHPHCIQPIELYKGKYIVYSLGNCLFSNFSIPSHFDQNGKSTRTYRFKWQSWNRRSIAVVYDPETNSISHVDELYQKGDNLICRASNVSPKKYMRRKNPHISKLIYMLRKYYLFFVSNLFVDGKLFDVGAIIAERRRKNNG